MGGPSSSWGTFDHSGAGEQHRDRWTDGDLLGGASGTAPLTFQWRQNGRAISGATSATYTTPPTTASDNAAQFTVVVSNSAGSATSNSATLTVNAATFVLNSSATSLAFGNIKCPAARRRADTEKGGNSKVTISNVVIVVRDSRLRRGLGLTLSSGKQRGERDERAAGSNGSTSVENARTRIVITIGSERSQGRIRFVTWAQQFAVPGYEGIENRGGPEGKLTPSPVAATDYADSSVQQGQTYYYVVTAVNSQNAESAYSAQVSAAVP